MVQLKSINIALFGSLIFSTSLYAGEVQDEELWLWDKNSKSHTFSVRLREENGIYTGSYCAVGMGGRRIDCSPKYAKKFNFTKENTEFYFITNYSSAKGKARLIKNGDKWVWEIIEQPSGEHYAPSNANLSKHSGEY